MRDDRQRLNGIIAAARAIEDQMARFLLDANQSPLLGDLLVVAGHDAVHVRDLGLAGAPDTVVLAQATRDGRVIISADTDFGELMARCREWW